MFEPSVLLILILYVALAALAVRAFQGSVQDILLAAVNALGLGLLLPWAEGSVYLIVYGLFLLAFWSTLSKVGRSDAAYFLTISLPLAMLCCVKYFGTELVGILEHGSSVEQRTPPFAVMIGLSFMVFRLIKLAVAVRNHRIEPPTAAHFFAFTCFLPTLPVGPIGELARFSLSKAAASHAAIPWGLAAERILVGAVKYFFLGTILQLVTFEGLLFDGNGHAPVEIFVAGAGYYLYIYCNFSGFCDMAIGVSALIGIEVEENFDRPFTARNLSELWRRWHITLGTFMSEMIFMPLAHWLGPRIGRRLLPLTVSVAVVVTFLLLGLWHGATWNFVAFGVLQSIGVLASYHWGNLLRSTLGVQGYARYLRHRGVLWSGRVLTFAYMACSCIVFANDPAHLARLGSMFP
ncbi:MAG: hypothetical protein A2284_00280 [Deltaproteobacteria bacterium RIFOXYA12_FULL_61_11]|nr:MAG: hypothetical protein A2284_00280 [Deltaproteobacteria bacterium RIFOXYA12_FULL_61_11]